MCGVGCQKLSLIETAPRPSSVHLTQLAPVPLLRPAPRALIQEHHHPRRGGSADEAPEGWTRKSRASLRILSTEGRGVRLCWEFKKLKDLKDLHSLVLRCKPQSLGQALSSMHSPKDENCLKHPGTRAERESQRERERESSAGYRAEFDEREARRGR